MIIITQKMLLEELHLCNIDCLLAFLFFHLYIIHKLIIIDIINLEYFRPKKIQHSHKHGQTTQPHVALSCFIHEKNISSVEIENVRDAFCKLR